MALGYSEELFGMGRNIQSLMQDFFHSYSVVLDKPAIQTIENKLGNLIQSESSLATDNPYKVMHSVIFPEATWFEQTEMLDFLKQWFIRQQKAIRVWSVGSGLGYEPYSISCCFSEVLGAFALNALPTIEIIGSDMSIRALAFAKKALYSKEVFEKNVSWLRKRKFFKQVTGFQSAVYTVKTPEKERVTFIEQDILKNLHPLGDFDVIFCTQILPYFSKNLRYAVACRLSDRLKPGGYLFLGNTELNTKQLSDIRRIELEKGFLYQKLPT
ncbi:MAG: hypothetical protein RLZ35_1157 [Pseudomonadota bacterium]